MVKQGEKSCFCCRASYTLEAAIYIPMILFLLFYTVEFAIDRWEVSKEREVYAGIYQLDIVSEFYGYQIMEEIGKEIIDDES